jgi:hypothetical protein
VSEAASGALPVDPAWGAAVVGGGLVLRPRLEAGAAGMEARGVRVHRTLLDLSARRRPGRLVVRVARRFGPDLGVDLAWGGPESVDSVLLDDHPLEARAVRFVASGDHEAQFLLAEGSGP